MSIGMTFAFFHPDGKIPCARQDLKIILRGFQVDLTHNLIMQILIVKSSPPTSAESSLLIIFLISSIEKVASESDLSVFRGKSEANVLPIN